MRADVENLTAYQHLVGETASDTLPAGYVHALAFPVSMSVMNREDFPLPLLGMIHLKNRIEQLAPIQFSEQLDIRSWAENLAGHRAGTQLDVVAEVRSGSSGDILWRGVSTYLAKGVFLPGIDKPGSPNGASAGDFSPPDPTALWQLGLDTGRSYATVSGDFNPIHLSVLSAKAWDCGGDQSRTECIWPRVHLPTSGAVKSDSFTWDVAFEAPVFLPARVALDITTVQADSGSWERSDYVAWNPPQRQAALCRKCCCSGISCRNGKWRQPPEGDCRHFFVNDK